VNGALYFLNSTNGIWKSDGTESGTANIYRVHGPYPDSSCYREQVAFGKWFIFTVDCAIWRSDGTIHNTNQLMNISPGQNYFNPYYLTTTKNLIYFSAEDGISGRELWATDGSLTGTVRVADIWEGGSGGDPQFLVSFGDLLVFTAEDGHSGRELWAIPVSQTPAPTPTPQPTPTPEKDSLFLPFIQPGRR
jgi:ELWxxDGT repeat protein